jgi:hypothetical protein
MFLLRLYGSKIILEAEVFKPTHYQDKSQREENAPKIEKRPPMKPLYISPKPTIEIWLQ